MPTLTNRETLSVVVSGSHAEQLRQAATDAGLTLSSYLRNLILEAQRNRSRDNCLQSPEGPPGGQNRAR